MTRPPCHYGFQVYTRELSLGERHKLALPIWKEKYGPLADMMVPTNIDNTPYKIPTRAISLMWNQRSVDVPLGLPFNIASYGLLLEIIAKEVNMVPDELIASLGDAHIYVNQIDGVKEQLKRESYPLPKLVINDEFWNPDASLIEQINHIEISDFEIKDYQSHPTIKMPLSN
jgi:thymidylate synthase